MGNAAAHRRLRSFGTFLLDRAYASHMPSEPAFGRNARKQRRRFGFGFFDAAP